MEDFLQSILEYFSNLGDMFENMDVKDLLRHFGYLIIVGWTFLEGETIVIIAGAAVGAGELDMDVKLIALAALAGSFAGDQFYFAIGRRYGTPLLEKWPHYTKKIDWAFQMLRKRETLFILSFRFIYGIRNVAPFVIGMSGISPLKYLILNFIAASIWACSFAFGGYFIGEALEKYMGEHKADVLLIILGVIVIIGITAYFRKRSKVKKALEAHSGETVGAEHIAPPDASLVDEKKEEE